MQRPPSVDHDACGVGFIAQLGSAGSREVVERALTALARLSHRGGVDADGLSGDGSGLLLPLPTEFFRARAEECGIKLPVAFGVGMAFLPPGKEDEAKACVEKVALETGLQCFGWREVPTDHSHLGPRAAATIPLIRQCFFGGQPDGAKLERLLYLLRKRIESEGIAGIYFCSLSSHSIVYKGLLGPLQLREFYADLADPGFVAPFALFHQRYSTNTQPSWKMAQPFRMVAHNGEINTIGANRRWVRARQKAIATELEAGEWFRALEERVSDSASFDNALELLTHRGYALAPAILRMVPPAWEADRHIDKALRHFFETNAREQEPWDGPAALVFSDGKMVGAKLDRNGLRPLRYTLTSDGLLILGSETGITDLTGKHVAERQRLGPGDTLLVDPVAGTIFRGNELAALVIAGSTNGHPKNPIIRLAPGEPSGHPPVPEPKRIASALGWSDDQYKLLFQPLGIEGKEATWSMGDDAPPAFISSHKRPIWDYCKQRFAQVTNPAIDPLREAHVMSLDVYLGPGVVVGSPVLDPGQMAQVESRIEPIRRIDITYPVAEGVSGALAAIDRIRKEASHGAQRKTDLFLLTDRAVSRDRAAVPAMLALSAAWKEIAHAGAYDVPVIVESGQVIETHHIAMLVATGASAVFPYVALQLAENLKPGGAAKYRGGVEAGLRKVLARMGISTIASYRNSQLFETVGLDNSVHEAFFEDSSPAFGGKSLESLLEDSLCRHTSAYSSEAEMQDSGLYRFRQTGERHSNSPELVRRMHKYVKAPTAENYALYQQLVESRDPVSIRDLFAIEARPPISVDEVEPESAILSRFSTQAMSLGALGPEAHRTLAIGMNRLGAKSNTGEGGEDPDIYRFEPEANNKIKQIASARFGVTAEYLSRADEIEIKISQGSKPGEGGQLPASKVNPYIARMRHAVPGMSLISPPPHHDIYSIEDLAQLIYDLRTINPAARIGVKLVSGAGVGIIAAGVAKAGADVITIAGFDGGTGASPLTSIKNTGFPWEFGLRDAHNSLLMTGFRHRVRLRVDGGFKFGRDVIIAALLGADEFGFGTASLLAIGCVMARQCHLNTCPAGIATQDETMRARFPGNPEMVVNYFRGVAQEVRERLASIGARSLSEIAGAVDRLHPKEPKYTAAVESLLETAPKPATEFPEPIRDAANLHKDLARAYDRVTPGTRKPVRFPIANSDRTIGAYVSGHILRRTGYAGLKDETIDFEFRGSAGQSFGAFLISGLRFRLQGEANDYVGKCLSGGTIAISSGADASRRGDVLVGNTVLYGATSGELYVAGRAGERFAVRNSGALAIIEGVGHHGCEYMTSGITVILGPVGVNLGSGMTGGLIYALRNSIVEGGYNKEFVRCTATEEKIKIQIDEQEEAWLRRVLGEHLRLTGSPRAKRLLKAETPLPLVRVEPVHLPCPITQTWEPIITRLERKEISSLSIPDAFLADEAKPSADPLF